MYTVMPSLTTLDPSWLPITLPLTLPSPLDTNMSRHEPQQMTHLPGTKASKVEELAGEMLEEVATELLARIRGGEAKAADLRVALELIKYTGTQDSRMVSPVRDLEKEHPFDSIDQEIA